LLNLCSTKIEHAGDPTPLIERSEYISLEGATSAATASRPPTGHRGEMSLDLGLTQQVVEDRYLPHRAFKPNVVSHGPDVQRTVVRDRNYAELAHAAGVTVSRLIPLNAVHPDVNGTGIRGRIRTCGRLGLGGVFHNNVEPFAGRIKVHTGCQSAPEPSWPIGLKT
jgi:hypothetical protein